MLRTVALAGHFLTGVFSDCRYDGRFFTSAEWDEGDGHHFDGHIEVQVWFGKYELYVKMKFFIFKGGTSVSANCIHFDANPEFVK